MIRLIGTVLALTAGAVLVDVAIAGDTRMVIPSRSTAAELDALSHRSNVVADVLTVDRTDYVLTLDGSGVGAFSGEGVSGQSADPTAARSAIRIPFEQMALVYYVEIQADKKNDTFRYPTWGSYPSIAAIGAVERTMGCGELDTEIARAGTIRWYARQHGVVPFTEHEALAQHGKNAAKDVGLGLLVAMALVAGAGGGGVAGMGGGGGFPAFSSTAASPIDQETFRWAVTAADRREVGLLQLKHERLCAASATIRGENTDLEILTKIEGTRKALATQAISDQEQMRQQTQLLDQFDPEGGARIVEMTELEASDYDKRADAQAGALFAAYDVLGIQEPKNTDCSYSRLAARRFGASFQIRERALIWLNSSSRQLESLPFEDIQEVRPLEKHYQTWIIPIMKLNGSCAFLSTVNNGYSAETGEVDVVRAKIIDCMAHHCTKIAAPARAAGRVATAAELAAGFEKVAIPEDEGAVTRYSGVLWCPSMDALGSWRHPPEVLIHGTLALTEQSVTFLSDPSDGSRGFGVHTPYRDIASVEIHSRLRARDVVMTRRDGHIDSFQVNHGILIDQSQTEASGKLLRSKVQAQTATSTPTQ